MGSLRATRFALAIVMLASGCASVPSLQPFDVVESRSLTGNTALANYFVTVHVLLQVHPHPNEQKRALQDSEQVAACQERIVATAVELAESGVRAIVTEGIYAAGTLEKPQAVRAAQVPATTIPSAKWLLANRADLAVYGFEVPPLNEFGVGVVNQLGTAAAQARALSNDGYEAMSTEQQAEYAGLIQDEVIRLNLWYAGVTPERSFLALQTALAVALARRENRVQLILGKAHWSDLVYAVNRQADVRLRLVPHACD